MRPSTFVVVALWAFFCVIKPNPADIEAGITGHIIERVSVHDTVVFYVPLPETTFVDTGVMPYRMYCYRSAAISETDTSLFSPPSCGALVDARGSGMLEWRLDPFVVGIYADSIFYIDVTREDWYLGMHVRAASCTIAPVMIIPEGGDVER